MRHVFTIFCVFASTTACTSMEHLRPDMEARPLPSRADEVAYINDLRQAYDVVTLLSSKGDQLIPCYTGADLRPFRPKYVQGYPDWDPNQEVVGSEKQCLQFKKSPGDPAITRYLESGFGLTDLYCQRYFIIATETRQSRKLQRGLFKTGDTLMNAVLSALSAGANPIAISSAGFSAIDSGYGAIDDAFVVAPTREDVRDLVHSAQQKFRAEVFGKDSKSMPESYGSARGVVEGYAGLCTFDGMRQLVANSVKETTDKLNADAAKVKKGEDTHTTDNAATTGTAKTNKAKTPPPEPAPDRVIPMVTVSPQ